MTLGAGWVVISYVVLTLCLLLLHVYTRWPWRLKASAIVAASAAYLLVYFATPQLLGWPANGPLPARFRLLGVMIDEPDADRGNVGAIYFWGSELDPEHTQEPRAYHLPYTQTLQAQFEEAHGKLRKNIPQLGEVQDETALPGVAPDRSQLGQISQKIKLKDAPAEGAPVKDAP
jgi:hypothetical protein